MVDVEGNGCCKEGMAVVKREWLLQRGMVVVKRNGCCKEEWLLLRGMVVVEREWLL